MIFFLKKYCFFVDKSVKIIIFAVIKCKLITKFFYYEKTIYFISCVINRS